MEKGFQIIWDLPTRLTHWALALCVTFNLFIVEEGEVAHEWLGYTAVGLVVFRFIWGFIGSPASRFTSFNISPKSVWSYVRNKLSPVVPLIGHNPLACLVYIGIWILIIGLGVTGFMAGLDAFWGNQTLEDVHSIFSEILQILILIHLLGLTLDGVRKKKHSWLSMITGKK